MNVSLRDQLEVLTVCYNEPELGVYDLVLRFPDLPIMIVAETYRLAQKHEGKGGSDPSRCRLVS